MKQRRRVLGLLCLLLVITYLDRVCISVSGPRMQEALSISPRTPISHWAGTAPNSKRLLSNAPKPMKPRTGISRDR